MGGYMSVMKAKILDSREEGESHCYLVKITLEDYINGLSDTYQDYEVQREIVTNVYLDRLVDTVLARAHIPPIVLVVDKQSFTKSKDYLLIKSFKILDGLQRTVRLQSISETINYCLRIHPDPDEFLTWNKFKFSKQFSSEMRNIDSNTDVLRAVLHGLQDLGEEGLRNTLSSNDQWFEVWAGLTAEEEVKKMLTLNAGHKPVKARHQLELLFLNLLPILQADDGEGFKIAREKEISATQFSKNRECGSFHFAHIITALLSYYASKPIATTTSLIQGIQSSETALDEYAELITPDFLKSFVAFLVRLDKLLMKQYGDIGVVWMGREITLAGLFGALGFAADQTDDGKLVMRRFLKLLEEKPKVLNLDQFESARNSLDLSKVNIGNVNRTAVYTAIKLLLSSKPPVKLNWTEYFGTERT